MMEGRHLAEAAMLALVKRDVRKFLISATVHPESREVVKTYAKGQRVEVIEIPS